MGSKGKITMAKNELQIVKNELELLRLQAENQLFVAETDGYSDAARARYRGKVAAFDEAVSMVNRRIAARTLMKKAEDRPSDGSQ